MATFGELQTEVQNNVIDLPDTVAASVPSLIQRAIRKLESKHNFFVMKAYVEYTTASLTRVLGARPDDWKELRETPYYIGADGHVTEIQIVSRRDALRDLDDELELGGPPKYLVESEESEGGTGNFEVWPVSDSNSDWDDGEYRIVVPYWKRTTALSANDESNWFTVNAEEYLIARATAYGFIKDWDEARADFWMERAKEEYNDILLLDKYRWLAAGDVLVPHLDQYEPRTIR